MKKKCIVIAEAGVNHNGDFDIAKKLIDAASEANADFVKFQTFNTEKLVSKKANKADYQLQTVDDGDKTQFKMLKRLEIPKEWYPKLINYCDQKNIGFLSTPFDLESIEYLYSLDLPLFKVPSGEITNKPYLQKIARYGKPIIISSGMANLQEIKDALTVLQENGASLENVTVLHCNTQYPTSYEDVNLYAMKEIHRECKVRVGYSDHTLGFEVPIASIALGAEVIEKHFTLDRKMEGPDHKASLEPNELKNMITMIRNTESAVSGDGVKRPSPSEIPNIPIARKSIHLKKNVEKGDILKYEDLIILRPNIGISPMEIDDVVGRTVNRNMEKEACLTWSDIT